MNNPKTTLHAAMCGIESAQNINEASSSSLSATLHTPVCG